MIEVALNGKKGEGLFALIDLKDLTLIAKYKWYISTGGYARTTIHIKGSTAGDSRCVSYYIHRLILGEPPHEGVHADHVNRDRLDNRRENLRWVTHQQNCHNSNPISGFKGTKKDGTRWTARLRNLHLGSYGTDKEAALVYDKTARHFFGEYAYLNFPEEQYEGQVRYIDFTPDKIKLQSEHMGVSYFGHGGKRVKRWRAVYCKKTLGYFMTELEAAEAYKEAKHGG